MESLGYLAVAFLFVLPVMPVAAVVVLLVVLVKFRLAVKARQLKPRSVLLGIGVVVACCAVLVYAIGLQDVELWLGDLDEMCMLRHHPGDWSDYESSLFPLGDKVTCGGVVYEAVPAWINPTLYVLLAAAVGCIALWAVTRKRIKAT